MEGHGIVGLSEWGGGLEPLQFLNEHSTLSQPGWQIVPTTVLRAPLPPEFSDLATALKTAELRIFLEFWAFTYKRGLDKRPDL